MTGATPDSTVARALTETVRTLGAGIADDPARVRACLHDVLLDQGRAHRSEIDAVVLAAQASIPVSLRSGHFDRTTELARICALGLSPELASGAIDAWATALGVATEDPSATVIGSTVIDQTAINPGGADSTGSAATVLGDFDAGGSGIAPPPPPPPPPKPSRVGWFIGGVALAVAILIGGFAAVTGSDDPPPPTTTTTTVTTTTTTTTHPSNPPVAVDDAITATVPQYNENGWFHWKLEVLDNDSGDHDQIQVVDEPTVGTVKWNSDGNRYDYTPPHNGDYYDSFTYELINSSTGERSRTATVSIHVLCNTEVECWAGA